MEVLEDFKGKQAIELKKFFNHFVVLSLLFKTVINQSVLRHNILRYIKYTSSFLTIKYITKVLIFYHNYYLLCRLTFFLTIWLLCYTLNFIAFNN